MYSCFHINEQLTETVQKTNNVNKIFTIAINTAFKDKNSIKFETYSIFLIIHLMTPILWMTRTNKGVFIKK